MKLRILLVISLLLVAWSPPATADETLNKAREAFDQGQSLFEQQKFEESAASFLAAYEARGEERSRWRDWWCSRDAAVYQFIGEDNIFFYGVAQTGLWLGLSGDSPGTASDEPGQGELQLTQLLTRRWRGKAWLGTRAPLTYSEVDVRFGSRVMGGVGAQVRAADWLLIDADASWTHRWHSRERGEGTLLNSGGDWLDGELRATVLASERVALGASLRVPLFTDVNGQQVAQSVGVGVFGTLLFGLPEDEHDHGDEGDHGDEHDGHGDEHDGHGDEHDGHGDEHDGHGDEHDDHGDDDRASTGASDGPLGTNGGGGDVAVLASGGQSFGLAAAGVAGKLTVVDFWATWCKPCVEIEALLVKRAAADARLAVRKVEVPTFDTAVAREHLRDAKGLPTVWVIGPDGAVLAKLEMVTPAQLDAALDEALAALPAAAAK